MALAIPQTLMRPIQLVTRVMQWISAVIVMSLTAFFISRGPRGQHIIYQIVIATLSVVFFLPAFISPFMPTVLARFVFLIDVIFSYLWLTAFIFAAQDYNWHQCLLNAPPGLGCSRKKASEAFIFLAFIFTFFGMLLELLALWSYRQETKSQEREKDGHAAAPVPAAGAGAGSAPATSTV